MMRIKNVLGVVLLLSSTGWGMNQPSLAVRLMDGTVYFNQPPSLVKATTTYKDPQVPSTYYFTLSLPEQAGEPLQRVTFAQYKGLETIAFDLKRTEAEDADSRQQLTLGEVTRDRETKTVSVTFNPPIPPGRTIKIGLHAIRNPLAGGVYLFGVTAYPAGEKSHGQFLGYGRLQFLNPGGGIR
ncbi:MAG: DUF2808 domain-containing protein [Chroococcidiopsidaceae cyanobacterium CP_BM_ER_R8_30]|nr:DUF2808 domain-containing protein [Chroococcidiopsidaceae cyanobacterium CP_BM_ER_R8_30]